LALLLDRAIGLGKEADAMPRVRICSVNGEWMNDWFTPDADPNVDWREEFTRDGQTNDTEQTASRLAAMIRAIDPDVLALEEGPSRRAELALFVRDHLADAYESFLGDSGAAQKLGLLYKPGSVDSAQLAPHAEIADLIEDWDADVNGDAVLDLYGFTRTPLVVDLVIGGHPLQTIVAHTKSNFINRGRDLWEDPATRQSYIVAALVNRRRISAEGMRIRRYLDRRLTDAPDTAIMVLGDLNDGPGLDYFEERYITHNVTDILVGSAFAPERVFTHAQHDVAANDRYTAVFEDFVPTPEVKRLLLDHILLSPGLSRADGLRRIDGSGAIRHAEHEAQVVNNGIRRQDRPSDHRPVTVDLEH
jgi:endonuclease/exonuclease/phosphatase family metal-dependent hydrolase